MATHKGYGPWLLKPDTLVLVWPDNGDYEVDLEDCLTPARVREWFRHLNGNNVENSTYSGLKYALGDILGFGIDFTSNAPGISRERLRELVDNAVRRGAPVVSSNGSNSVQVITNSTVIPEPGSTPAGPAHHWPTPRTGEHCANTAGPTPDSQ